MDVKTSRTGVDPNSRSISIHGITGLGEIREGDDLASLIFEAQEKMGLSFDDGDIYVVSQKVVSKAEGRLRKLSEVVPSAFALRLSATVKKDPRELEVILQESRSIVKARLGIIITETRHGIVCANSGVDRSNVKGTDWSLLLPVDPDASARRLRRRLERLAGRRFAVVISDTFGRPWREGQVDFAIGVSGIACFRDYRGTGDMYGRELRVTSIAQVDEISSAAELIMGKARRIPAVVLKGYDYSPGERSRRLLRRINRDLFR
jgi:coenzyme F420-0:L-glutamate ligase/coenzyme F420-1:gamma-L-glutamate ligase